MDSATGTAVEEILFDLNRREGITLVVVTHDEDLAARCDRRLFVRDGLIVPDSQIQPADQTQAADQIQSADQFLPVDMGNVVNLIPCTLEVAA